VFGKILELILSAKSSAVSGVLILAGGAVVSASSGAGVTGFDLEETDPTPIVEVVEPEESPLDELLDDEVEEPDDDEVLPPTAADCDDEGTARGQARERIETAFKKYDAGLDVLRTKLDGKGSAQTYAAIDSADALLAEIREQAIGALADMGLCDTEELGAAQGAVAFAFRGGAAALHEVAERAIEAMEVVYDLARSTVMAELERLKPTPTPKPKKTEAPKKSERPKATKAPRCEDAMYAAKSRLQKAFDKYHGGHDKLMKELKGWASESSMKAFWAADQVLHKTYDRTREKIVNAGCATGEHSAMGLAETAEQVLEQTYSSSRELFQTIAVNKPEHDCSDSMYAAKDVMYEAFDRWHGANDKLINGLKSFASEGAIEVAKAADRTMHETFDRTKQQIVSAPCTKDQEAHVMELAKTAAHQFEVAHQNARIAVAAELAKKPEDDK
jgi:hypothetical protein